MNILAQCWQEARPEKKRTVTIRYFAIALSLCKLKLCVVLVVQHVKRV